MVWGSFTVVWCLGFICHGLGFVRRGLGFIHRGPDRMLLGVEDRYGRLDGTERYSNGLMKTSSVFHLYSSHKPLPSPSSPTSHLPPPPTPPRPPHPPHLHQPPSPPTPFILLHPQPLCAPAELSALSCCPCGSRLILVTWARCVQL